MPPNMKHIILANMSVKVEATVDHLFCKVVQQQI